MGRFRVYVVNQTKRFLQSKFARPTAVVLALFLLMPIAALAQGSPVLWCGRAREIAQEARRMIAGKKTA